MEDFYRHFFNELMIFSSTSLIGLLIWSIRSQSSKNNEIKKEIQDIRENFVKKDELKELIQLFLAPLSIKIDTVKDVLFRLEEKISRASSSEEI